MVRHHVLIGLGFKRKNFRNRALKYLMDRKITTNLTTIVRTSKSQAVHKISQGSHKHTSRVSK